MSNTTISDLNIYNHRDDITRHDLSGEFIVDQEVAEKVCDNVSNGKPTPDNVSNGKPTPDNVSNKTASKSLVESLQAWLSTRSTQKSRIESAVTSIPKLPLTSVFSKLNHTHTYEGHYCLKEMLELPHSDEETLKEKQNIIIKMYRSPGNVTIIRQALRKISALEDHVAWIWGQHNQETLDYIEKLFFSFNILNREVLLNFHTVMEVYVVPLSTILIPIMTFCVTNYLMGSPTTVLEFLKSFIHNAIASYRLLLLMLLNNDSIAQYGAYVVMLLYVAFYAYKMYVTFNQSYKLYCQHCMIRSYFEKVHEFTNIIMEIFQQDLFVKPIKQLHHGSAMVDKVSGALLRTIKTFDVTKYTSGYCLLLWKRRHDFTDDIKTLQWYIGRIDAWTSLITLMQSIHDTTSVSFTIPQFQWQYTKSIDTPFIDIKGMWHPCVANPNSNAIVKNDIQLGKDSPNNIILTGPNAAGKSTFLKSLTLNVYLAHTLGIACCDEIVLTPMGVINTYMNIPDSIGKESLFEAEMNQSLQQLERIENAQQNNQFVFSVMDEIFTGTNYHEGVAGAYAVCKKLHQYKNSLNVVSTHFSFLTELEQEHPDSFKNYRMEINMPVMVEETLADNVDTASADNVDTASADNVDKSLEFRTVINNSANTMNQSDAECDLYAMNNSTINEIICIDAESETVSEEDDNKKGQNNIYTYKIESGINQYKIALDLLKNRGFPEDVVKYSTEAIHRINNSY